jgi:hypothetical protein
MGTFDMLLVADGVIAIYSSFFHLFITVTGIGHECSQATTFPSECAVKGRLGKDANFVVREWHARAIRKPFAVGVVMSRCHDRKVCKENLLGSPLQPARLYSLWINFT